MREPLSLALTGVYVCDDCMGLWELHLQNFPDTSSTQRVIKIQSS